MPTPILEETKDTANELLLEALDERWKKYRTELGHCRDEFSNAAIHDLRVATRRMLAFIGLWDSICPRPRLKKLKRAFKDQLDKFDELRDTQVILEELSKIVPELPQLQEFQTDLQSTEKKLFETLRKKIDKLNISKTKDHVRKTRASIEDETNDDLASHILQAVDGAFLRVKQRKSNVDLSHSATIHHLRVAFKSFRYMVEIVCPLLPGFPDENFKRMNEYQSLMGEIQDAEVFTRTLSNYTKHASLPNPAPVRHYEERRHADSIFAYEKQMNGLDRFWRPAPDHPFPWEKTELS